MPDTLVVTDQHDVRTITLNRPQNRNAMNLQMVAELRIALEEAEGSSTRLLVIQGSEGHFCAGGDIADMAKARTAPAENGEPDGIAALSAEFGSLALRYARTSIPVLAVLEGAVMGGGFGLACTADVVVASTSATFRLPETSLGVVPRRSPHFSLSGWATPTPSDSR